MVASLSLAKNHSELIQTLDSLTSLITWGSNIILLLVDFWSGKSKGNENSKESPLLQISLNQLIARLGQYGGKVPWIDREAITITDLRKNGRVAILGQIKIGKTREAIELIRRAINSDLVSEERIFQLSPNFRFHSPSELKDLVQRTIDLKEPILLFIDDFSRLSDESLLLLDEAIKVFESCKDFYFVVTAPQDEISGGNSRWLKKQTFATIRLQRLSRNQISTFVDEASSTLGLSIGQDAKALFVNLSNGSPEIVLIGFRRLLAEGHKQVNALLAQEVTFHSLYDSWVSTRKYILGKKPAAVYILKSLASFHITRVFPYPSMVLAYANYLWKTTNKDDKTLNRRQHLIDALMFLRKFDFWTISGEFLFPEAAIEGMATFEDARNHLGGFLLNFERFWRYPIFRNFYLYSIEQSYSLLGIALGAQERGEPYIALKYYSAALRLTPYAWIYLNRGSCYGGLNDLSKALDDFNKADALSKNSKNHVLFYSNRSLAYIELGDLVNAQKDVDLGLALYPNQPILLSRRGALYLLQGRIQAALLDFDTAIQNLPDGNDKAYALTARANLFAQIHEYEKALRDCNQAIKLMPDLPIKADFYRSRANLYSQLAQHRLAIMDYSRAIQLKPDLALAYFSRAYSFIELGNNKNALDDFSTTIKIDPSITMAYIGVAQIYADLGEIQKALQEMDLAIGHSDKPELRAVSFVRRALIYEKVEDFRNAISDYSEAIDIQPQYSYAYLQRANLYEEMGDFEKVVLDFTALLGFENDKEDRVRDFNKRGSAYDELGKYELAIEDFKAAIILDERNPISYMNYGITLHKQGDLAGSITYLSQAIKLNPKLWEAYANRGTSYSQIGDFETAISDHTKAISHQENGPNRAGAFYNRGNTYLMTDLYDKAIKDFTSALKNLKDPAIQASCYYRRGLCYWRITRYEQALKDLDLSIGIDPEATYTYLLRGNIYANRGQVESALSDYGKALSYATKTEEKVEVYRIRGNLYAEIDDYDLAIFDFGEAIALDSHNAIHYFNGGLGYLHIGKLDKALLNLDQAISLNSEYFEAYNTRGQVYSKQGEHEKALLDFDRAILYVDDSEKKVDYCCNKAITLQILNRGIDADDAYSIATGISPTSERIRVTRIQMELLRGNHKRALDLIEEAEKMVFQPNRLGYWKASALIALERFDDAFMALKSYLESSPLPGNYAAIQSELASLSSEVKSSTQIEKAISLVNEYSRKASEKYGSL